MGRSKDDRDNILQVEHYLGFWWPRGISRQSGRRKVSVVKSLLDIIDPVIRQHSSESPTEIRASKELDVQASKIFDAIGPRLWPDEPVDRSAWLATDVDKHTLDGLYPRDLYFSDPVDQAELRDNFHELMIRKSIKRHWNALHAKAMGRRLIQVPSANLSPSVATDSPATAPSDPDEDWTPRSESPICRKRYRPPRTPHAYSNKEMRLPSPLLGSCPGLTPHTRSNRERSPSGPLAGPCPGPARNGLDQNIDSNSDLVSSGTRKLDGSSAVAVGAKRKRIPCDGQVAGGACTSLMVMIRLSQEKLASIVAGGIPRSRPARPDVSKHTRHLPLVMMPSCLQNIITPSARPGEEADFTSRVGSTSPKDSDLPHPCPNDDLTPLGTDSAKTYPVPERAKACRRADQYGHYSYVPGTESTGKSDSRSKQSVGMALTQPRQASPLSEPLQIQSTQSAYALQQSNDGHGVPTKGQVWRHTEVDLSGRENLIQRSSPGNFAAGIRIEVDWKRTVSTHSQLFLEDCKSLQDFFKLLEDQLPRQLWACRDEMMQVRIKAVNTRTTRVEFGCRIVRDSLGRASLRQMLRKLRLWPSGDSLELLIQVDWQK